MPSPMRVTDSPYPMLPVEEALNIVLRNAGRMPVMQAALSDAGGLVLADDITARDPLPPFAASIKDGYAVVAADGPGEYPIVGEVRAGAVADFSVKPGTVAYITTGAPIPQGADAVVMIEDTEQTARSEGKRVRIKRAVNTGADVRPVGVDVASGQRLLTAGDLIGAAEVGLLATAGVTHVPVFSQPKVAVFSTGDELVEPGQVLEPGQIRDSNRYMLIEAVRAAGARAIDAGVALDGEGDLERLMEEALASADVVVSSGGVSMGDMDLIKPLLNSKGTVYFGRILMKPGKPFTFATVAAERTEKLFFGLPGNPVSSLVTFHLLVVPALRSMMGFENPQHRRVQAYLAESVTLDPDRPEYHRATLTWDDKLNGGAGGYVAESTGSQSSSRLLSMRSANALLELPASEGSLPAGSLVSALLIGAAVA